MVTVGLVVELEAKADKSEQLAAFLTSALPLAQAEPATIAWFAMRTSPTTFWIVDAFPTAAGRQAHLDGPIAAALMASADELLASPPRLLTADVLASKLPG
ncbi:putative quinol monooxygenase [Gemmatimonas sp.]|uniref:putative quinol monooxygenase n=1 Tax=Gemmatimonas sp. TaxID=1962908 RepID=UPI003982DACB